MVMSENILMDKLAKQLIKDCNYDENTFYGVAVGNNLENEVCDWLEYMKAVLMNWDDHEWTYKNGVYEMVCELLSVSE